MKTNPNTSEPSDEVLTQKRLDPVWFAPRAARSVPCAPTQR